MKNMQLLRWKAIVVAESVGDYKGGKKKRGPRKDKRGLPTNHTRLTCPTKLRCWSKEDERCLEHVM